MLGAPHLLCFPTATIMEGSQSPMLPAISDVDYRMVFKNHFETFSHIFGHRYEFVLSLRTNLDPKLSGIRQTT